MPDRPKRLPEFEGDVDSSAIPHLPHGHDCGPRLMTTIPDAAIEAAIRGYVECDPEDLTPDEIEQAIVLWSTDPVLVAPMRAALTAAAEHLTPAPPAEGDVRIDFPCCRRESIDYGTEDCLRCEGHLPAEPLAMALRGHVPEWADEAQHITCAGCGEVLVSGDDLDDRSKVNLAFASHLSRIALASGLVVPVGEVEAANAPHRDQRVAAVVAEREAARERMEHAIAERDRLNREWGKRYGELRDERDDALATAEAVRAELLVLHSAVGEVAVLVSGWRREHHESDYTDSMSLGAAADAVTAALSRPVLEATSPAPSSLPARSLSGEHVGRVVRLPDGTEGAISHVCHIPDKPVGVRLAAERYIDLAPDDVVVFVDGSDS